MQSDDTLAREENDEYHVEVRGVHFQHDEQCGGSSDGSSN